MYRPLSAPLLVAIFVAGYLGLCSAQVFLIQENVGLAIPFLTVLGSTVKLIFDGGPWVPFLMAPPLTTS